MIRSSLRKTLCGLCSRSKSRISARKKGIATPLQSSLTKTCDRVFILGSGPSINDLSQSDFDHIAKCDSWGFNFWFVHDFVPSVFFAQVGKKRNRYNEIMDAWDICLEKVAERYKTTKFVLRGGDLLYGLDVSDSLAFRQLVKAGVSDISILPTLLVPKDVNKSTRELFEELGRVGLMQHASGLCAPVPQIRATVGLLYVVAIQMGYKEIVLCGVDGKDRAHFFDQDKYMTAFPELTAVAESYKIEQHPTYGSRKDRSVVS